MTVYDSLHSLLDCECVLFHHVECRMSNEERRLTYERILMRSLTCPLFIASGEPNRNHHLEQ
jgi:hypothetical protein